MGSGNFNSRPVTLQTQKTEPVISIAQNRACTSIHRLHRLRLVIRTSTIRERRHQIVRAFCVREVFTGHPDQLLHGEFKLAVLVRRVLKPHHMFEEFVNRIVESHLAQLDLRGVLGMAVQVSRLPSAGEGAIFGV